MSDSIPIPEKYPESMMIALGVLLDGMRKQIKQTPEITGAQMLSVMEKAENIVKMFMEMVNPGGQDDKKS